MHRESPPPLRCDRLTKGLQMAWVGRAQAIVCPVPERPVILGIPAMDVEAFGILEDSGIAVRGAEEQQHRRSPPAFVLDQLRGGADRVALGRKLTRRRVSSQASVRIVYRRRRIGYE